MLIVTAAHADVAKEDALHYKDCIIEMTHVSVKDISGITTQNGSPEKKAETVAHLAAARCKKERAKLSKAMQDEGKTGAKYDDVPDNIEKMSVFDVKLKILDALLKSATVKK